MALQELNIYGLWAGKQTAKGTRNATPRNRFKQVAGNFQTPREDGTENFSDLTAFPDAFDWANTLIGNGNPGIQATPEETAWLLWAFQGGETTRAITGPPAKTQHIVQPLPGLGHWLTFYKRIGSSTLDRSAYVDSQIGQIVVEGSTANKAVRVTPTVISLDPAEQIAADPAQAMPAKNGFLYTDGTGRFTIDGTVFRGHSQFTLTVNKDLQPVYSDDVTVYDLGLGNMQVTLGCTLYFDADGLAQFNKLIYGTAAPAAGAKPMHNVGALGSYGVDLRAKDGAGAVNGDKFVLSVDGVKWNIPTAPEPNADGGTAEIALAGSMRKVASRPAWNIAIDNDAAAFTV